MWAKNSVCTTAADLFWSPASGHLLVKTNVPHLMLTTRLVPHLPYEMSILYSLGITNSYCSQSGTKTTDYLNNMVHLFCNPGMDSDAVGDL